MTTTDKTPAEMGDARLMDQIPNDVLAKHLWALLVSSPPDISTELYLYTAAAIRRLESRPESMGVQDSKALELARQARKRLDRHPERPDAWRTSVIQKVALDAMTFAASGEWQPIETAPRDGQKFLFVAIDASPAVFLGCYARPAFEGVIEQKCLCYFSYCDNRDMRYFRFRDMIRCGLKASHWMPLPQPPEASGEGQ